jgi:hypothetical protein
VAGRDLIERISVRARFERFPATVKGAFILRGEDGDPHQVELRGGTVVGLGSAVRVPMPVPPASLDVAPRRDVFVPFEVPLGELEPGWYTLEADLEVDGVPEAFDGGRRFSVPWPRATVRRGQVKIDRQLDVGDTRVRVEQLDLGGDSAKLHVRVDPPGPIAVKLWGDEDALAVLEVEQDDAGRTKVTSYPVMRTCGTVRIELKGHTRGAEGSLEVPLPH